MADEKKNDRILIVDDTPRNIQVLGTILKEQGYQINVAQNGLQALDVVAKVPPDIILLDVMMPELDGFETCKRLKADPSTDHIPVIFLTAKVETEDIINGFELGAIDYVTKPFNPTELLARVDTHLMLYKLKRNLEELVEARTEELREAHRKLQTQVKELESRDRLTQLQMKSPTFDEAYEEILKAVEGVIGVSEIKIYRIENDNLQLTGSLLGGQTAVGEALSAPESVSPSDADSPVAQAYTGRRPVTNEAGSAVPVLFDEDIMGVIWAGGVTEAASSQGLETQDLLDALWRLTSDSALVLRGAALSSELETGEIDVDALLNLGSDG
jgi:DNA-binding response OmpR family regulator